MTIRKTIVAGNWKMNGSLELVEKMSNAIRNVQSKEVNIVLFPPYPLVAAMASSGVTTGVAESKICAEVEKESSVIENKNVFMVFLLVQF